MSGRFITESDIADNKKKIKEAWDATRGEEDPAEPPEQPQDNRTLFCRLEEQKIKKQEEFEDAHRLKNMVRGLEDEEVQFLDLVDRTKMEQERRLKKEENSALSEFRKRRAEMEMARTSEIVATVAHPPSSASTAAKTPKNSQKLLLSGAIKRKTDSKDKDGDGSKKSRTSSGNSCDESPKKEETTKSKSTESSDTNATDASATQNSPVTEPKSSDIPNLTNDTDGGNGYLKCIGYLPGIGPYSDSSDTDSSCDSDPDTRPRMVVRKLKQKTGGGCC